MTGSDQREIELGLGGGVAVLVERPSEIPNFWSMTWHVIDLRFVSTGTGPANVDRFEEVGVTRHSWDSV